MSWLTWVPRILAALGWYLKELVTANVTVVADVFSPGQRSDPVIVRYATRCRSELEVALLSILVTLTPGTLTVATVARDDASSRSESSGTFDVYVHAMFPGTPDRARAELETMETKLLSAVRRRGAPPPAPGTRPTAVTGTGTAS